MPSSANALESSFLRQLSTKEGWKSTSNRWLAASTNYNNGANNFKQQMENSGYNNINGGGGGMVMRKRVMVVVDETSHSKHAMMWALTHVTNKGDMLTLLHIIPPSTDCSSYNNRDHHQDSSSSSPNSNNSGHYSYSSPNYLATSLGSLCKASKPEVEVEALVIQGPKFGTVMSQVKKLEVAVLVLGQKKPSPFLSCLCGGSKTERFVDKCINGVECLTIGVSKQSRGIGGYLISTRWQKNFWLLA